MTLSLVPKKGLLLSRMILHATQAHAGQFDKGGKPYILHPLHVMHEVEKDHPEDEELLCIAIGHDLFEDTKTTKIEMMQLGMTQRIIEGITALTKMPGQDYDEYKEAVKANPDAVKVKKKDLLHNADLRRLKGTELRDMERQTRYLKFYAELESLTQFDKDIAMVNAAAEVKE